jgi:hypothetical protein
MAETPTGKPGLLIVRILTHEQLSELAEESEEKPTSITEAVSDLIDAIWRRANPFQ